MSANNKLALSFKLTDIPHFLLMLISSQFLQGDAAVFESHLVFVINLG